MKLIYENERGKVVLKGGASDTFNITQIKGLSLPENDASTIRYPNVAGQTVTKSAFMERMITISADVRDKNRKHIAEALSVFSSPGTIYITSFGKTKKIDARCVSFEPNKSKGAYIPFTVQFCADNPYFEDIYETKTDICLRNSLLKSPFVLGCRFSERTLKNNVINRGDTGVEPVFEISSRDGILCPSGIAIKNLTNGNSITLNTDIEPGEVITVDIKNRKVISSKRGNIISCVAQDNSLSRFLLDIGVSSVEIVALGATGELTAQCIHNNSYISAVV